jgi:hypothetical protein
MYLPCIQRPCFTIPRCAQYIIYTGALHSIDERNNKGDALDCGWVVRSMREREKECMHVHIEVEVCGSHAHSERSERLSEGGRRRQGRAFFTQCAC